MNATLKCFDGTEGAIGSGRIAIVVSRYNGSVCESMLTAAIESLIKAGIDPDRHVVIRVPGAWELCFAIEEVFKRPNIIAAIALGCVIRGETTHDEHINRAVSDSLMRQSIDRNRPIGFGLLTCNTLEQAIQRSGGSVGNKGHEATDAVLEMLRLQHKIR
ncbi:MAG: 6,7-dimethyl-8-ribityllumazine synthase [Planctomycetota bacterium]